MSGGMSRHSSELLIKYGFVSDAHKGRFAGKSHGEIDAILSDLSDEELANIADHEIAEEAQFQIVKTAFPRPLKRYRLWWEAFNMSIEESYFWVLEYMRTRLGMPHVVKTADVFSAAENSAFFGVSQQRLGLQQDKVSQFLATIGKMVKELFQLVRELRIIDERMGYYKDSFHEDRRKSAAAEITLKGIYVDIVEQGAKNPASVYGMARELQFATLPDLFFATHPRASHDVNAVVNKLQFNDMIKRVLKRKLYGFLKWKEMTYKELKNRRNFTLKFLNQHWEIIRMYMNWVRPYLKHIKRLTMDESKMQTPDLISAFEGSMIEIQFLAYQLPAHTSYAEQPAAHWNSPGGKQNKHMHACILAHFHYRTRPGMSYQQEGYNRGPIHFGLLEMDLRSYVWSEEQVHNYIEMKEAEDLELMETISGSVKAAMEALGDELLNYLKEAKSSKKSHGHGHGGHGHDAHGHGHGPAHQRENVLSLLVSPIKGVGELFGAFFNKGGHAHGHGDHGHGHHHGAPPDERTIVSETINATERAKWCLWETYKDFKKEHHLMQWG